MAKPNFLFLFPDQWRGDFLGSKNHLVKTPFLDQLAGEGINFTKAYSACPSCIAARACVLTGKTPISNNRIGYKGLVPWDYPNNMLNCLSDNGYQTINVGKTHFYPRQRNCGFQINKLYDSQNYIDGEESDYHQWLYKQSNGRVEDTAYKINSNGFTYMPWTSPTYLHPTAWTASESITQLKKRDRDKPFFMQVGFHRPHPPLDPPKEYFNMYHDITFDKAKLGDWEPENYKKVASHNASMMGTKRESDRQIAIRAYCAQLTFIDHEIGKILYHILRHEPNTVIIFTSDHGEMLGDHNVWRKIYPYEGSANIPMIIKEPISAQFTHNKPGDYRKSDTVITHMDIMPTVLSLAGIKIPDEVEGKDFVPLLRNEGVIKREYLHGEHSAGNFKSVQFITDGKYKFCYDALSGIQLFFDLQNDPNELHNAVNDENYKEQVMLFKQRMINELSERSEGFVKNNELQKGIVVSAITGELRIKNLKKG